MRTLWPMLLSLLIGLLIAPLRVSAEPTVQRSANVSLSSSTSFDLQAACPGNRLVNSDFEGGFSERGRGEISVANGWTPWYNPFPGTDGYNYIPEYKPEDAQVFGMRRVHSGRFAQKWFTTFATHTAGLFQQVSGIPVGAQLQFSAWVQVWSSDMDHVERSEKPGNYRVMVGIDPYGGTDYTSSNIVWSDFNTFAYDAYRQLSVQAVAQNNTVTVFLRGEPEFRVKHNDSYWDDACLTVVGIAIPAGADAAVDTAALNFRAGPGTEYDIIGTLRRGSPLQVKARLADNSWLNVTDEAGTAGWVFAGLLRLGIDLAEVPIAQEIPPTPSPIPTETPVLTPTPELTQTPSPAVTVIVVTATPQAVSGTTGVESASGKEQRPSGPPVPAAPGDLSGALNCAPALISAGVGLLGLIIWPRWWRRRE